MSKTKNNQRRPKVGSSGCSACAECGCTTGHKIDCKTGNERARAYQAGLAAKHRKKRKPMFSIEQAADWRERFGISCDIGTARDAMEYAVTMKQNDEMRDAKGETKP